MQMEEVLRALGAEPIDWSYKTDRRGATLGLRYADRARGGDVAQDFFLWKMRERAAPMW